MRAELLQIHPFDAEEEAHLSNVLAWIESGAPLYRVAKPSTPPKHLVAYFAVINDKHILLVDHKNAQRWLPTGGHVEPGEDPRSTVVRELKEELGLTIGYESVGPPTMVTVTDTVSLASGHTDVSLWYVVRGNLSAALAFDRDEFIEARWFPFAQLPDRRCEPHLKRFISKVARAHA